MVELKPCPWCLGPAETRNSRWHYTDHWGVACQGCGNPWFDYRAITEAEAIAAWNTRASESPTPPEAARKRIAELEAKVREQAMEYLALDGQALELMTKVAALKAAGDGLAEALSPFARAEFIMGQHDGTGKMEAVLRYSDTQPETFTLASIKEARTALTAWSTANGD